MPKGADDTAKLTAELREIAQKYPHTAVIERVLFHPAFPVDKRHNAKIHREELTVWAKNQTALTT
jgi:hypothetical protein